MSEDKCTCHCGGAMFYRHLHDDMCPLSVSGEEAPKSEVEKLRDRLQQVEQERDGWKGWCEDARQERDRLVLLNDEAMTGKRISYLCQQLATMTQERDEQCEAKIKFHHAMENMREQREVLKRQLAEAQGRVKELEEWKMIVIGAGTDQESVVRMAAAEYTKTAVQSWKKENTTLQAALQTMTDQRDALARAQAGLAKGHQDALGVVGSFLLAMRDVPVNEQVADKLGRLNLWLRLQVLKQQALAPATGEQKVETRCSDF